MCKYKTLAHNENGYVILCSKCRNYQLAFGTTAVSLPPYEFKAFKRQLNHKLDHKKADIPETQKCISFELCRCVMMVLNGEELVKLHELISLAAFTENMEGVFEDINLLRE